MKISMVRDRRRSAACPVNPGRSMAAGMSSMAALTNGEHSRLAVREKKANVPKCRSMIGAVVI